MASFSNLLRFKNIFYMLIFEAGVRAKNQDKLINVCVCIIKFFLNNFFPKQNDKCVVFAFISMLILNIKNNIS